MTSTVFVLDQKNALSPLTLSDFASEDLFQSILADHPALLSAIAGEGGALLLVEREASVPDELTGTARWSLDHLFLDREGVPVLIEVKRASDTRIRREVVAQMLDYAANGVAYWPIEQIVEAHRATAKASGENPDEALALFLDGADAEAWWRQVEANLRSGRIRMVFVADQIPKELRRIVEFLNEQMRPAEVLALQVEHYAGENGLRMLMPRLIGQTERAASAKSVTQHGPRLSLEDWLATLSERQGPDADPIARRMIAWAEANGLEPGVTASNDALAFSVVQQNGKKAWPFFLRRSSGKLETSLQYLASTAAYEAEGARAELLSRFKSLPGTSITTAKTTGWPSVPLSDLKKDDTWGAWTAVAADIRTKLVA